MGTVDVKSLIDKPWTLHFTHLPGSTHLTITVQILLLEAASCTIR